MRAGTRSFNGFRWNPRDRRHTQLRPCLRSCRSLVRLAAMFRRNLLIFLTALWVIMPPLAQACATHCAMNHAVSTSGVMHDAPSMPGCDGAGSPAGGSSHSDGTAMAGLCLFAASPAMSMSFASMTVHVTALAVTSDTVIVPSLATSPPDKPPRS